MNDFRRHSSPLDAVAMGLRDFQFFDSLMLPYEAYLRQVTK